jgi:hypothetical protein
MLPTKPRHSAKSATNIGTAVQCLYGSVNFTSPQHTAIRMNIQGAEYVARLVLRAGG